jgi:hypothetical protein
MPVAMSWWGWLVVAVVLGAAEVALVLAVCRAAATSSRRPEVVPVRMRTRATYHTEGRRQAS